MTVSQNALTVVVPVIPEKLDLLRTLLAKIQEPDIEENTDIPFPQIKSIHFARFVIIEKTDPYPLQLSFSSNYDGDESDHIDEMVCVAGPGLQQIYACCQGYSGDIKAYWLAHRVPISAFYIGHRGFSVGQIRQEAELQAAIASYLDQEYQLGNTKATPAAGLKQKVQQHIAADAQFAWAVANKGLSSWQRFMLQRKGFIYLLTGIFALLAAILLGFGLTWKYAGFGVALLGLVASAALIAGILLLLRWKLNRLEDTDPFDPPKASTTHVSDLMQRENFVIQNQLTHLVDIKPGGFRLATLKFVLWAINLLAKTYFTEGSLGGIPSIHFARWVIIDQNKRLLFFSNFDGSWENYLGDFIDRAAVGLTGVWSNTKNFPRTKNLLFEGATDEQHFKEWTRYQQIPTQVWYSAYKDFTVQNINNNSVIRSGLFRPMKEAGAQAWLDLIYKSNG